MTGKRGVKTNLKDENIKKDTIYCLRDIVEMFNGKFVNFETNVEGPTTTELEDCIANIHNDDESMFAFPTNMTTVFDSVGNIKFFKAVKPDCFSTEVLKTSLPMIS